MKNPTDPEELANIFNKKSIVKFSCNSRSRLRSRIRRQHKVFV